MKSILELWTKLPLWPRRFLLIFGALLVLGFSILQAWSIVHTGEPVGINLLEFIGL